MNSRQPQGCLLLLNPLKAAPLLVLVAAAYLSSPTVAVEFVVTDTLDSTNTSSLRGAIIAANTIGGTNVVLLSDGVYPLTIQGVDEDACFTGDLDITNGTVTILGSSASNVTITAASMGDRVFHVLSGAQLSLSNLTVTGGVGTCSNWRGTVELDGEPGGGIYNAGALELRRCWIVGNASGSRGYSAGNVNSGVGGDGGGICSEGTLWMDDCIVAGNACGSGWMGGNGGGLFNVSSAIVNNCTFSNNASAPGDTDLTVFAMAGGGGHGGGVCNLGMMTLSRCRIIANSSGQGGSAGPSMAGAPGGYGAGIFSQGALTLDRCTVSGNVTGAGGNGGSAVFMQAGGGPGGSGGCGGGVFSSGPLTLVTCTISSNLCGRGGAGGVGFPHGGGGGAGGNGGGIYGTGSLNLIACTVIGNSGSTGGNGGTGEPMFSPGEGGCGGAGGSGGVVAATGGTGAKLRNTLVALNSAGAGGDGGVGLDYESGGVTADSGAGGQGRDAAGNFASEGHNLIATGDGSAGFTNGWNGDLIGSALAPVNPMLARLANYGGDTLTFALLPGSPAIDAGDDALLTAPFNLAVDQRSQPRKSGACVDIGSYEFDGVINGVVQPPLLANPRPSGDGPFRFAFNAAPGLGYSVWASDHLTNWIIVGKATETTRGWFGFQDFGATNHPMRLYRVSQP
jgi:hypothetical protein